MSTFNVIALIWLSTNFAMFATTVVLLVSVTALAETVIELAAKAFVEICELLVETAFSSAKVIAVIPFAANLAMLFSTLAWLVAVTVPTVIDPFASTPLVT